MLLKSRRSSIECFNFESFNYAEDRCIKHQTNWIPTKTNTSSNTIDSFRIRGTIHPERNNTPNKTKLENKTHGKYNCTALNWLNAIEHWNHWTFFHTTRTSALNSNSICTVSGIFGFYFSSICLLSLLSALNVFFFLVKNSAKELYDLVISEHSLHLIVFLRVIRSVLFPFSYIHKA